MPRIHTKRCGYLGLPQDTRTCCKDQEPHTVSVSSALEIRVFPCNRTLGDEPETMETGLYEYRSINLQSNHIEVLLECRRAIEICERGFSMLSPVSNTLTTMVHVTLIEPSFHFRLEGNSLLYFGIW